MLRLTNPHTFYRLGCRKKSLSQPFFRFGFGASRSILSRFFDLNGFVLFIDVIEFNLVRLKSKYFLKMNECNITEGDVGHETVSYI